MFSLNEIVQYQLMPETYVYMAFYMLQFQRKLKYHLIIRVLWLIASAYSL